MLIGANVVIEKGGNLAKEEPSINMVLPKKAGYADRAPLVSVVIPTRDRPDTLKICLEALRLECCADIEFVIQDNASTPATWQVVVEAAQRDDRIVYFRSEKRLSQRHNFELGIANARGDYMSIIGDDDAFCRGALQWMCNMVRAHSPDAMRWPIAAYIWPSLCEQGVGMFSFNYEGIFGGWTKRPRQYTADKIVQASANSWDNIMVYHGLISRRIYEAVKKRSNGTFFSYHLPDVYAHNVLAFVKDETLSDYYIDVRHPMTVYGMSGHSSGASWTKGSSNDDSKTSPGKRWEAEILTDPLSHVPWQKPMRTMHYHDYVALSIGRELGLLGDVRINEEAWIQSIIAEVAANPWQIRGFMDATKIYPFDDRILDRVLSAHNEMTKAPIAAPSAMYTLYEPWHLYQQTCVKAVLPDANDDVAGAVEVLHHLLGSPVSLMREGPITKLSAKWKLYQFKRSLKSIYEVHKQNQPSKEAVSI